MNILDQMKQMKTDACSLAKALREEGFTTQNTGIERMKLAHDLERIGIYCDFIISREREVQENKEMNLRE